MVLTTTPDITYLFDMYFVKFTLFTLLTTALDSFFVTGYDRIYDFFTKISRARVTIHPRFTLFIVLRTLAQNGQHKAY